MTVTILRNPSARTSLLLRITQIEIGTARTIAVGQERMSALTQDEEGGAFQSFVGDVGHGLMLHAGINNRVTHAGDGGRGAVGDGRGRSPTGPAKQAIDD
ncbi:hypothetical protein THAOC_35962 [Thalassiosira oceanica]|uniref:Uncharacterized protein n=1 Tax=Thalassiosira oceanica TaxID=159749 RepID=K0R048_THAOC|nr:hypothetical protein THAOC_35962 [Thalassiosira oceanica]|eukprot:EJK45423.1 hypothetical protein THAOC_35962 [Thalassiosira oceanica]